jgi:nitric oxide reductase NorE protein
MAANSMFLEEGLTASNDTQRAIPGDSGVWVFVTADICAFAVFFLLFTVGRMGHPALYERSREALDPNLGLLNTVILLTSSWFMVRAVEASRAGKRERVSLNLALAMLIGAGFALTKVFEYGEKFSAGLTMLTNEFFTYYFVFTGIHFLHFLVGMGALAVCLVKSRKSAIDERFVTWIEATGSYWHMVDLLWVVLFPMLYLLRAS